MNPSNPPVRTYKVFTTGTGRHPAGLCLGTVSLQDWRSAGTGWCFYPNFQASRSRRLWPTPEAALARRVDHYRLEPVLPKAPA